MPAGRLGLTFWGRANRMGLMPYFAKMIELSPPDHGTASMEQGDTGRRGVMEDMLATTGFEMVERGTVDVVNEWPDVRDGRPRIGGRWTVCPRHRGRWLRSVL